MRLSALSSRVSRNTSEGCQGRLERYLHQAHRACSEHLNMLIEDALKATQTSMSKHVFGHSHQERRRCPHASR
jgi:hypothetical protein